MAKNLYLHRKPFRAFLEEAGDDVVGATKDDRWCPVAVFLGRTTNRVWNVSTLACVPQVDREVEKHEFKPPRWARDFIEALDAQFGKPTEVTGREALYVLDEAVR